MKTITNVSKKKRQQPALVFSTAIEKGGTGKTTTAVELLACFADKGYKCLGIDLDQQRDLSMYVNADLSASGIYEALIVEKEVHEVIQHLSFCDLIPASAKLSKADKAFVDEDDELLLREIIKPLKEEYDVIIIDGEPGRSILTRMQAIASDYYIVPCDSDKGSMAGLIDLHKDLNRFRSKNETKAVISHIVQIRKERSTSVKLKEEELINTYIPELSKAQNFEIAYVGIAKSTVCSDVKDIGMSVQEFAFTNSVAKDYRTLTKDIIAKFLM